MSLVTIIWSMSASASLTLAAINLMVWFQNRKLWANLLFSLLATGTAGWTICEMLMMHAATVAEFSLVLKWGHVAIWLLIVSLVGFVRLYLKSGRSWIAWTVFGTRTLLLFPNFLVGQNLNFLEITRLGHMKILGESVTLAEGTPNPWIVLGEINLLLLIIFVVDAAVMTWRRGERHRALTVGGSIVFFVVVSVGQSLLMHWKVIILPYVGSIFFMGLVLAMGYELSSDTIGASELGRKLQESEKRFRLMADSAPSLIWMSDDKGKVTYLNEQRRAFTGEDPEAGFGDSWKQYVHPDDLQEVERAIAEALETHQSYSKEYRLRRQDGSYRWMLDIASPRFTGNHVFTGFIGSAVDVTDQKLAEEALKRVGGQLIEVQEQERSRIARELHDDICQRLILLSIEIEQANRRSENSRA
ncbi:MAG TPA: PAS domain S-box protein, partial [Terriglobia bacterium]|nr:PAS domain S-box protein [Terriglobia bacterium]